MITTRIDDVTYTLFRDSQLDGSGSCSVHAELGEGGSGIRLEIRREAGGRSDVMRLELRRADVAALLAALSARC